MKSELKNWSKNELLHLVLEKDNQLEQKNILIAKLQRMLFGTKSEGFKTIPVDPSQLALSFEELALKSHQGEQQQTVKEKIGSQNKNKNHPGRHKLPGNLPEHVIVIEPQESIEGLIKIGEERTEILEMVNGLESTNVMT